MPKTKRSRVEQRLARLTDAVREAGVKLTHQRLEIFRELAGTEEHPDAETLFEAVRKRMPTVSLDTVYRTLSTLQELGLVKTIGQQGGGTRFDANLEPHHHYTCVSCGMIRDFESNELNSLRLPGTVRRLGTILDANVEVRGLCAKCQRGQKASKRPKSKSS